MKFKEGSSRTLAGGIEGAHVEDVDALHLSENLETLETGGLLEIGGDAAGLGTRSVKVILALDLCIVAMKMISLVFSSSKSFEVGSSLRSYDAVRRDACGRALGIPGNRA